MLILNGGGSGEKIRDSYEFFASHVGDGRVLYIPLAWINGPYEGCFDWFKTEMKPYGITNIEMITDAKQITSQKLKNVKGVFIGGGNTFKLLKMLKETCAFENLKQFALRKDRFIMGGSAGTLIFGKSIDACKKDELIIKSCDDINDVGLKDSTGFNLVGGYSLYVHYKKIEEQIPATYQRIQKMLKKGLKLICIPEESSLIVDVDKCFVLGNKQVDIYENTKPRTLKPNEELQL